MLPDVTCLLPSSIVFVGTTPVYWKLLNVFGDSVLQRTKNYDRSIIFGNLAYEYHFSFPFSFHITCITMNGLLPRFSQHNPNYSCVFRVVERVKNVSILSYSLLMNLKDHIFCLLALLQRVLVISVASIWSYEATYET